MERDDFLAYLVEKGHQWLCEQRNLYMADACRLSDDERMLLKGYYDSQTLGKIRLATTESISNPTFYPELVDSGNPVLDISESAGITFIDCVVIRKEFRQDFPAWISIVFHELLHVVQYEILGARKLVESYLLAWAQNGYQYYRIPFEVQAHSLELRFDQRESPFSVGRVVEKELKRWRFLN